MLVELNSSNATTARYTLGPRTDEVLSMRRGSATYHYLHDAQGSVVRLLDASRNVKNSYEYLPWGEIRTQSETVTNRYGYTGREKNPDGRTMHYRARTYLPHLGRFAQEDPAGFVDGVNLYRYAANSPCNAVDPFGLHTCAAEENGGDIGAIAGMMAGAGLTLAAAFPTGGAILLGGTALVGGYGVVGARLGRFVGRMIGRARGDENC